MEKGPISLRRIFGLVLLFLFFEVVVAVLTEVLFQDANVFLTCVLTTVLALAVWVVVTLVTRSASRPAAPGNSAADAHAPKPSRNNAAVDSAFTSEMKKVMIEANGRLSSARMDATGGPKAVVTALPLYLVVGPPGSGKTSAIVNSGLEPRLLAGEAFRDSSIIPTASCNFWFAGGAIFADVSGRVFFDEPDHWESLLRLLSGREHKPLWRRILKPNRTAQNLRGIVLVCEVKNFLDGQDAEQSSTARKIHERLQTAGSVFGVDFPVYSLFSNADEMRYFAEFFAHLGDTEDQRTLGATLPLPDGQPHSREVYAEAANKRLTSYFNRLCASVASKRMTMLGRESFPDRKSLIYEFPRELKRLRPGLVQFLVDVFRPNPLQRGPRLRGFYFSGVRPAAREVAIREVPGEASMAHMGSEATYFFGSRGIATSTTALPPAAVPSAMTPPAMNQAATIMRWSFLSELFGQVVLPDHAAEQTSGIDRRVEMYQNIALGAATLLLLLLSLAWLVSWAKNRQLLNQANNVIANVQNTAEGQPSLENLEQLDAVRRQLDELRSYEAGHPPLSMRWGLYSGDRAIAALRSVYFARFRKMFLDPVLSAYVSGFSQLQASTPSIGYSDVYGRLKAYRMIAACHCRPDKALLDRTLPAMLPWSASLSREGSTEAARLSNLQIAFYTSELVRANPYDGQISENENAVKQAQSYLQAFKGPDRLLRDLLDRVNREHESLSLAKYSPNYHEVLNGPDRIEWVYTREGRDQVLKRIHDRDFVASGEPCVVGINAAAAGMANWVPGDNHATDAVEELYVKEYIQRWKQFLAGYSVLPYHDAQDAASKLTILSDGNRSPLLALFFMVSSNTYVQNSKPETSGQKAGKEMAERATDRGLNRWFPSLQRGRNAVRDVVPAAPPVREHATIDDIGRAFQPAWTVVDPKNPDRFAGTTNAAYIGGLVELGDSLRAFGRKLDPTPDVSVWDEANKAEGKAVAGARQLEGNFNRTPEDIDIEVKRLVEEPIQHVRSVLPENPGQLMAQTANAAAAKLCRSFDQLKRRYPFNPSAREDTNIDELNRYFAPGSGDLAQFIQQPPFASLLQRQGRTWIQNPAAVQPRLSPQFLSALSAQTQFAEMLYPDGATQPRFDYTVSLAATTPILFELETGNQNVQCNGLIATSATKFSWPAAGGGDAKLTLKTALTVQAVGPGLWGIFRLLGKAQEHQGGLFVFSRLGFEGDSQLLQDASGKPFTLRISVDSKIAEALFEANYFSHLACTGKAAQ
jgi:type VI secretion system protein ImpL